jgi:hypothetical protein
MDTDINMDMNSFINLNESETFFDDDDIYDYIAIIKNKKAYNDFVENVDDSEREFDKVTQVYFGENVDFPIDDLPSQITQIKISKNFSHQDSIPSTVKKVIVKK